MFSRHEKSKKAAADHDSTSSPATPAEKPWSRSGEGFARGLRYVACVFAGYLLGIAAAGASDPIPLPLVAFLGAVALWLVFRRGRASVANAAADAVANANARANAAAVNANHITVAGGHVVQGHPPVEAYEPDIWSDFRDHEPVQAYEVGTDAITGARLYEVRGRILRGDQLTDAERASIVPVAAQLRRGDDLR